MKKGKKEDLDFIIDKLTNSIELVTTGKSFDTIVTRLFWEDRKQVKIKYGNLNDMKN